MGYLDKVEACTTKRDTFSEQAVTESQPQQKMEVFNTNTNASDADINAPVEGYYIEKNR